MKSTLLDPPPLRHPSHTGNFYGKGDVRRGEMVAAAGLLGIQAERVEVLDHPELQVGGKAWMHMCVYIYTGRWRCDPAERTMLPRFMVSW